MPSFTIKNMNENEYQKSNKFPKHLRSNIQLVDIIGVSICV